MNKKFFAKHLLFPLLAIVFPLLSLGIYLKFHFPAAIISNLALITGGILIAVFERKVPFNPEWNRDHGDTWLDITYAVSDIVVFAVVEVFLLFGAKYAFDVAVLNGYVHCLLTLPPVIEFFAFYFLVEFLTYAYHYWEHHNAFLWGIHEIHHSSSRVYAINSLKMHAFEAAVRFIIPVTALTLVGGSNTTLLLYTIHSSLIGLLQHANVEIEPGVWNRIFSTPDLHRVHHSIEIPESNHNYGKSTTLYDVVFGTYDVTGLKHLVGIPYQLPNLYWKQFFSPFRKHIEP